MDGGDAMMVESWQRAGNAHWALRCHDCPRSSLLSAYPEIGKGQQSGGCSAHVPKAVMHLSSWRGKILLGVVEQCLVTLGEEQLGNCSKEKSGCNSVKQSAALLWCALQGKTLFAWETSQCHCKK